MLILPSNVFDTNLGNIHYLKEGKEDKLSKLKVFSYDDLKTFQLNVYKKKQSYNLILFFQDKLIVIQSKYVKNLTRPKITVLQPL